MIKKVKLIVAISGNIAYKRIPSKSKGKCLFEKHILLQLLNYFEFPVIILVINKKCQETPTKSRNSKFSAIFPYLTNIFFSPGFHDMMRTLSSTPWKPLKSLRQDQTCTDNLQMKRFRITNTNFVIEE